jgi:hypothetical protein
MARSITLFSVTASSCATGSGRRRSRTASHEPATRTGITYAAMPRLLIHAAPRSELAAANGLKRVFRSVAARWPARSAARAWPPRRSRLAGHALPSLGAYRIMFAICVGAATLAALLAVTIPRVGHRGRGPDRVNSGPNLSGGRPERPARSGRWWIRCGHRWRA